MWIGRCFCQLTRWTARDRKKEKRLISVTSNNCTTMYILQNTDPKKDTVNKERERERETGKKDRLQSPRVPFSGLQSPRCEQHLEFDCDRLSLWMGSAAHAP